MSKARGRIAIATVLLLSMLASAAWFTDAVGPISGQMAAVEDVGPQRVIWMPAE